MFRKVLSPTDFSEVSQRALEYVKKLREAGTEEVIVLHVSDSRDMEAMIEGCLFKHESVKECEEETEKRMIAKAREKMQDAVKELQDAGISVREEVKLENPSREIARIAEEEKVSLIIMGTHGHSPLCEAFVGNVAENVIHHSTVPVLLVRR
ncbi:MAG: universal stress protein [Euryarchaeota archaeon]|nr:universal stress protein [Euryarchaeota archaeon]